MEIVLLSRSNVLEWGESRFFNYDEIYNEFNNLFFVTP